MQTHLAAQPPSASVSRLRWLCTFAEGTGLRAGELLAARRDHLEIGPDGWLLHVVGKGRRARQVPIPGPVVRATERYFRERHLDISTAGGDVPLLGSLRDPRSGITYQSLHETFTRFVRRALRESRLSATAQKQASAAALHWLRHTHATRAAERGVPADVLQEQLGHADPRQTAHYYRAQMERRRREMERAFGHHQTMDGT
jgi:integrase